MLAENVDFVLAGIIRHWDLEFLPLLDPLLFKLLGYDGGLVEKLISACSLDVAQDYSVDVDIEVVRQSLNHSFECGLNRKANENDTLDFVDVEILKINVWK